MKCLLPSFFFLALFTIQLQARQVPPEKIHTYKDALVMSMVGKPCTESVYVQYRVTQDDLVGETLNPPLIVERLNYIDSLREQLRMYSSITVSESGNQPILTFMGEDEIGFGVDKKINTYWMMVTTDQTFKKVLLIERFHSKTTFQKVDVGTLIDPNIILKGTSVLLSHAKCQF